MPDIPFLEFRDLFQFFRYVLGVIVTIYFLIITLQSLWGWYVWLSAGDRYVSMLRRYLVVQGLRLRFKAFWGDVIICILLAVAFLLLWRAQGIMDRMEENRSTQHSTRNTPHVQRTEQPS